VPSASACRFVLRCLDPGACNSCRHHSRVLLLLSDLVLLCTWRQLFHDRDWLADIESAAKTGLHRSSAVGPDPIAEGSAFQSSTNVGVRSMCEWMDGEADGVVSGRCGVPSIR
jgi:hypothetical protein